MRPRTAPLTRFVAQRQAITWPGLTVTGAPSWYIFTVNNHVATETLTTLFIYATQGAAGTGGCNLLIAKMLVLRAAAPIDPANDYLHISLFIGTPANLVSVTLLIDVDEGTTTGGTPFTLNYYSWTLTPADLSLSEGTGSGVWADVSVPLSSAVQDRQRSVPKPDHD